jgi:hypothetical protein
VPESELDSIAQMARDLAYRQLDQQLKSSDNFDAKALGVLGFDGAALAAILAARVLFDGRWPIAALLVVISSGLAILATRRSRWDLGPDPRKFYDDATKNGVGPGSAARANVEVISEFGGPLGLISRNEAILHRKSWLLLWALAATVFAGVVSAILLAIPR